MQTPRPTNIHYHSKSRELEIAFSDGAVFRLGAEYLRVHSPSAEVRGHGKQLPILQHGKMDVTIKNVETSGNYAIKITFDDGHDTGLYTWNYLYQIGENEQELWQIYLQRLKEAGKQRQANSISIQQI